MIPKFLHTIIQIVWSCGGWLPVPNLLVNLEVRVRLIALDVRMGNFRVKTLQEQFLVIKGTRETLTPNPTHPKACTSLAVLGGLSWLTISNAKYRRVPW
jgi:hypothetical protein